MNAVLWAGLAATLTLTGPGPDTVRSEVSQGEVPVILVPGWFDTGRAMAALRIRLLGAGWPPEGILAMTFLESTGGNLDHAAELADSIDGLLARSGAPKVDIVAHSMGGLATRAYLRGGGAKVRRVIFLGTPQRGTLAAYAAFGEGRTDMLPESPFLAWLDAGPPVPEGVEALTIRSPLDAHVLPGESATLPGVPDHVVCCPTHAGLLQSLEVFGLVRRFLAYGAAGEEDT